MLFSPPVPGGQRLARGSLTFRIPFFVSSINAISSRKYLKISHLEHLAKTLGGRFYDFSGAKKAPN